jgi:hypothetical protein
MVVMMVPVVMVVMMHWASQRGLRAKGQNKKSQGNLGKQFS